MHTHIHTYAYMHCMCICMPNCMPDTRQFGYAHENTVLLTHTCIVVHTLTHTHTAAVEQFHFICKLSFFEYHIRFFLFSRPNAFKISSEIFFFAALVFHIRVCVRMHVCIFVLACVRTYVYICFNQCCQNSQILYKKVKLYGVSIKKRLTAWSSRH